MDDLLHLIGVILVICFFLWVAYSIGYDNGYKQCQDEQMKRSQRQWRHNWTWKDEGDG